MKRSVISNMTKRSLVLKNDFKTTILKFLNQSSKSIYDKIILHKKLNFLCKKSTNNFKNICFLSGRSRGVLSKLKISRIQLRDLSRTGLISGLRKSSW